MTMVKMAKPLLMPAVPKSSMASMGTRGTQNAATITTPSSSTASAVNSLCRRALAWMYRKPTTASATMDRATSPR